MYFNTSALARRLDREWTAAFAPFGLTPAQGFMLRAVNNRPGMAQSELAQEMSISRPTATRALDGLERLGFIERQQSQSDGRELEICPTKEGRFLREKLDEASGAVTKRLKRILGDGAFIDMVSKLKGIRSALD